MTVFLLLIYFFPWKFLRQLKGNENVKMTAQNKLKDEFEKWHGGVGVSHELKPSLMVIPGVS